MTPDPEEAELLALVAAAREAIRRTIVSSGVEPGIAAAACAELAGEYAAVLAARQDVPPSPVLDEVARMMRRHGAAAYHRYGQTTLAVQTAPASTKARGKGS